MLRRVSLEDFIIVKAAELEFGPGLSVLSGETGAGKSILVDALGFATGGRGAPEWVRPGADRLTVEATFELPDGRAGESLSGAIATHGAHLGDTGAVTVRRELKVDGKSRAFVNGRTALVSDLRAICRHLIRIVCQGDTRLLEDQAALEELLDRRAGTVAARAAWGRQRRRWLEAGKRVARVADEDARYRLEEDWLRFQLRELEDARIEVGEREELARTLLELRQKEADEALRGELKARLSDDEGSVLDHLESLLHRLRQLPSQEHDEIRLELEACRDRVRGLLRRVGGEVDRPDLDPAALEDRLRVLDRLLKKHGGDEAQALAHAARVRERIEQGEAAARELAAGREEHRRAGRDLGELGVDLSRARHAAADALTTSVEAVLSELGMPGAEVEFVFVRPVANPDSPQAIPAGDAYTEPGEGGIDQLSLRFRSHPSLPFGPLGRVASGGELSRVLLAIESSHGGERALPDDPRPVWVFDEIDAGVGGETALKVADRLSLLAEGAQVLLVTHQAAIAARAGTHYRVAKEESDALPRARVEPIAGESRLSEIARMLSGDERSLIARRHAQALMESARS